MVFSLLLAFCFLFFRFLVLTFIIKAFNPTSELAISIEIPTNEAAT